jgi:hypothetical protein
MKNSRKKILLALALLLMLNFKTTLAQESLQNINQGDERRRVILDTTDSSSKPFGIDTSKVIVVLVALGCIALVAVGVRGYISDSKSKK